MNTEGRQEPQSFWRLFFYAQPWPGKVRWRRLERPRESDAIANLGGLFQHKNIVFYASKNLLS
ncbi:hypothetical protein Sp245p_17320 (plasmid) [Azospirillum baldaniorum]|uniref:Uncharacterized protein n=1 Tax=Azospirillum baldaniorum TaxID=1064539 RepID=A0A9P1JU92_9PROT|nr:hypothetical protein Sp245p_17320 [Azospirillum baldaniorum]CCC99919.1 protein of unknown function [Azospirillum baldaniorum]